MSPQIPAEFTLLILHKAHIGITHSFHPTAERAAYFQGHSHSLTLAFSITFKLWVLEYLQNIPTLAVSFRLPLCFL
jgi:hypothetical protein